MGKDEGLDGFGLEVATEIFKQLPGVSSGARVNQRDPIRTFERIHVGVKRA